MAEENSSDFERMPLGGALAEKHQTDIVLACNEKTAAYGLSLTVEQAAALVSVRSDTLRKTGRIEFGGGILNQLIMAFCDSPYISQENYEATLYELVDLFYNLKNETADRVGDNDLIEIMKKEFNGECCGSLELLSGTALPVFVRKLNESLAVDFFENMEITDDKP